MGQKIDIKVYNHSDKVIDFELVNSKCMYLPEINKITAQPKEWVVFKDVETSHAFTSVCFFLDSIIQVVAKYDGNVLGSTKYNIYANESKYYWYATGSIIAGTAKRLCGVQEMASVNSKGRAVSPLIVERVASYGDLFFSGRDIFKDDSADVTVWTVAESLSEDGHKFPSMLMNNVSTIDANRNDHAFSEVVSGLIEGAGKVAKFYGDVKPASVSKPLAGTFKESWKTASPMLFKRASDFYAGYATMMQECKEISILVHNREATPSFHVVFTDALVNAPAIVSGNFDLPEPPDNHDTFWKSIRSSIQPADLN
ncbi:hypothetical protein [Sphingomonas sp.]|uniref:hypothetical protein n=1 Tax=Sphingomonas sp. TaxID=28214 RepID=UPI0028A92138|nr:hypothetical protein [Sphingomonas sp.]